MCPYNVKKDGTPDGATNKMMTTGKNWAHRGKSPIYKVDENGKLEYTVKEGQTYASHTIIGYTEPQDGEEGIYDNVPLKGFRVGQDATRWTTDNKVFRLHDPRGFTVEIPTGNLSTLIQTCTIINGEIMDECVWGRDGCHILLPINAPEYTKVVKEIERVEEALKLKDLVPGDWVKLHQYGSEGGEVQFVGMVKLEWTQHRVLFDRVSDYSHGRYYEQFKEVNFRDDGKQVIRDTQWVGLFASKVQEDCFNDGEHHGGQIKWRYSDPVPAVVTENNSVKITSRRAGVLSEEYSDMHELIKRHSHLSYYRWGGRTDCPERVMKKFDKQEVTGYDATRKAAKDLTKAHYTATIYQHA